MKIPFLSKKTKKVLKKEEQRIHSLSKEEFDKLMNNESIPKEELIKQLVRENTELKVLFDSQQDEIAKKIKKGKDVVLEFGKGYFIFHTKVRVLQDSRIRIKKKWEATIGPETEMVGKIPGFFGNKQFRCWAVESEGEYTYNPQDETPIEIKKKNEGLLEIGHLMSKKQLGASLINDLGSKLEKWWQKLGAMIIMSVVVFIFLLFIGMFFGQYNLTKAG